MNREQDKEINNQVLIIGGTNIDYFGKTISELKFYDSNVGKIKISFGGVGRNVCENLARLGVNVTFITAIGNDEYGKLAKRHLENLGVNVIHPMTTLSQSSYMAIHDHSGDMIMAISDMEIINVLTVDFVKGLEVINKFAYLVLDTNINDDLIKYIFENFHGKIIIDAISTTKVLKIKPFLSQIDLLKCNIYEAKTLVNSDNIEDIINNLSSCGVKMIVITSGANDIYYCQEGQIGIIPVTPLTNIINATGAGDAMLGGIVYGIVKKLSIERAIAIGKKLSNLSLMSEEAVSYKINKELII